MIPDYQQTMLFSSDSMYRGAWGWDVPTQKGLWVFYRFIHKWRETRFYPIKRWNLLRNYSPPTEKILLGKRFGSRYTIFLVFVAISTSIPTKMFLQRRWTRVVSLWLKVRPEECTPHLGDIAGLKHHQWHRIHKYDDCISSRWGFLRLVNAPSSTPTNPVVLHNSN